MRTSPAARQAGTSSVLRERPPSGTINDWSITAFRVPSMRSGFRTMWLRVAGIILAAGSVAGLLAAFHGCARNDDDRPVVPKARPAVPVPHVSFTDVTTQAGIRFRHNCGAAGRKLMPESLGSGCAFFDYDGDGHPDLLLIDSRPWPGFEGHAPLPTMQLYRNRGDGTFDDVTAAVGLDVPLFGMGVAVGDFDNDGLPDLLITALGGSRLFRNTRDAGGQHRFIDVTATAGDLGKPANWPDVAGDAFLAWSQPIAFPTSAAFLDYDKDGLLDLFVCEYVQWSPKIDLAQGFTLKGLERAYGPPTMFEGTHCRLLRNLGNGTFKDVTHEAGIEVLGPFGRPIGKALGVVVADLDEDGWPDIVVANDTARNFLFHNRGNGTFQERGQEAGVAYAEGRARGAMGIDWGEYRPGEFGLWIGNFANEPDTLLRLDHAQGLLFSDVAMLEGVAGPSRVPLVFGLFFFDYDLDGRLDCLTCNGHLEPEIKKVLPNEDYAQPAHLYWNTGGRPAFTLAGAAAAGPDLFRPLVGRGCAYADIDGNGTLDIVLTENNGPARLLRNNGGTGHHWVRLTLEGDGRRCNRSAIGAHAIVTTGELVQHAEVRATRGYLSCSELSLTFGLGKADKVDRVEIHWPGRDVPIQVLTDVTVDRTHRIRQSR
jgi:enediyne biosynthesis protein E4